MDSGGEVESTTSTSELANWIKIQEFLKKRLVREDEFTWKLPINRTSVADDKQYKEEEEDEEEEGIGLVLLKYVGGVDVSYSKEDSSIACGSLVVLDLHTLQVVYHDSSLVTLDVPYFPSFLAFREAPVLLQLLEKMKNSGNPFYPQLLMVDGNGLLHPRGFGLACHLGVLANIPTIGIGKNLHHVDGLTQSGVRQLLYDKENRGGDFIALRGCSGIIWGVAMRSTGVSLKPIFISVGNQVSLDTAIKIVKMTCKYRVPEPIRQADIRSRDYLRKHQIGIPKQCCP